MQKKLLKTLYIYKGPLDYAIKLDIIKDVLGLTGLKEAEPAFRKKIRYLADECITNIINYYHLNKLSHKKCEVKMLGSSKNIDAFEFDNYLLIKDSDILKKKIKSINAAGINGKKDLFIDTLKKELDKDALGAGLGLLTLKQKFNFTLKPSFTKAASGFCKFKLKVLVSAN